MLFVHFCFLVIRKAHTLKQSLTKKMMITLLAVASLTSSALAATKVVTRTAYTQCDGQTAFGSASVMSSVKNGCSSMGYADCTTSKFYQNSTDGLAGCPDKVGDAFNITGKCQAGNITLACADIDGSTAAEVTLYEGNNCNGTALPIGVITKDVCTLLVSGTWIKMWQNTTGSFVGTYTAAACPSSAQERIVMLSVSGTSGCVTGVLANGFNTVKWGLLELPATGAPTASGNGTNTTAPSSSSTMVAASLASVVVAAASLML
jgi:hypothetical protein